MSTGASRRLPPLIRNNVSPRRSPRRIGSTMTINETVLEMHFHRPLLDLIRETFGLGIGGRMNFYKYSPQRECFIGFDQAFAATQLSEEEFFQKLADCAQSDGYNIGNSTFLGYFLQYKVGSRMTNLTKPAPTTVSRPYIRFSVDSSQNQRTGTAQHELLYLLSRNHGAFVYYACPMLFLREDLYEVNVDLDRLRLVTLESAPGPYLDNAKHYIYFQDVQSQPIWASEPHDGKAIGALELAEVLRSELSNLSPEDSAAQLLRLLRAREFPKPRSPGEGTEAGALLPLVGEALTVIEVVNEG